MSMNQTPRLKGCRRDNSILLALEERGVLDTDQVRVLFFRHMQYGQRKSQERLLALVRSKKVVRNANSRGTYIYSLSGAKFKQVDHLVGVNWVRLWLELCGHQWEHLHSFEYEREYGKILRHDGFAALKNTVTGNFRFLFIEMDRGTNTFDKVAKYNKLYQDEEKYIGYWWVKLSLRFPVILIATTSLARMKQIQHIIKEENKAGLEFDVRLIDDIREEVMKKCLSPSDTQHLTG